MKMILYTILLLLSLVFLSFEPLHKKPTKCLGENEADQRLCFRSIDNAMSLFLKSDISRFQPAPEIVQAGCVRPGRKP